MAAIVGTASHAVLEIRLRSGDKAIVPPFLHVEGERIEISPEVIGQVETCARWVEDYRQDHPGTTMFLEERCEVGKAFGAPDAIWGTADVVLDDHTRGNETLVVADAKFGHHEVSPIENKQLLLYAIGLERAYGCAHRWIELVILQPKSPEPVKRWRLSMEELVERAIKFHPLINRALQADAELVPGEEQCRWCPAAGVCPALQNQALDLAKQEFSEAITVERLTQILAQAGRIRGALDAAEAHATQLLKLGQNVPGWKLVFGNKRRAWKDETQAQAVLVQLGLDIDKAAPRKVCTPPQAEKMVGKATAAQLGYLIETPKGEPCLAPADDPREPVKSEFSRLDVDDLLG